MSLKIIQHNTNKSRTATLEMLEYMNTNNIDMALVQEPYVCKQAKYKFSIPDLRNWTLIADIRTKFLSCIIIKSHLNSEMLHLRNMSSEHVTAVSLELDSPAIFIASPVDRYNTVHYPAPRSLQFLERRATDLAFVDADWGNCTEDRRSCTGFIFLLNGSPVSWDTKKQRTVALSTTEAEYMALAE
jgi:hypothetical protein